VHLLGSRAVTVVLGLGLALLVLLSFVTYQVWRVGSPPRQDRDVQDLQSLLVRVEDVEFEAVDELKLRGWLLRGAPDRPPVIFCHDLGGSKASLIHLAQAVNLQGFTALLFDFRGHGQSEGRHSSLGLHEKRDILGAVEYLSRPQRFDRTRMGIYGVGMGAHAAVLAAADRSELRVLVLDGLYPDAAYPLTRRTYSGWRFGVEHLQFLPRAVFTVFNRTSIGQHRAADVFPGLDGRDVLLLAPAGDSALGAQMRAMYESLPEGPDADGNLEFTQATFGQGLFGEEMTRYQKRVGEFFLQRLARQ
jgi:pimeloyl-ACP methyl ester carboxylesterase